MANQLRKSEITAGIFVLLGLVVLGALIFKMGNFSTARGDSYTITAVFDDASGLVKGGQVQMGGKTIGRIAAAPELSDDLRAVVELEIFQGYKVPEGAKYRIASAGLLGDKLVQIVRPEGELLAFLDDGAVVKGAGSSGLDQLAEDIPALMAEAITLTQRLQTTVEKADRALDSIGDIAEGLDTMLLNDENQSTVARILKNTDALTAQLNGVGDRFPALLARVDQALNSIEGAATEAQQTFSNADRQISRLEPALEDVPVAVRAIADASREAQSAVRDLREGDGLLATLSKDEAVANDVKEFARNLRRDGILRYQDQEEKPDPRERYQGKRR